uniref:Uncharacterized protein n=1 Tax=Kalanchoe fedtschenkoi TaxID=63787 RepID=A0A7N0VA67_KALFE
MSPTGPIGNGLEKQEYLKKVKMRGEERVGRGNPTGSPEPRLLDEARPLLKEGNYPGLVDERLAESHDVHHLYWMVRVAEKCLSKDPQKRPSMTTESVFSSRTTSVSSRSQLTGKSSPSAPGLDSSTSHLSAKVLRNLVPAAGSKEKSKRGIMRVKSSLRYNDMVD